MEAAQLRLNEAIAATDGGRLTEAVQLLHQGLAELGLDRRGRPASGERDQADDPSAPTSAEHHRVSARILLSLAFPQHELGHRDAASHALEAAERLAATAELPELSVLVYAQHGAILLRDGQAEASLGFLDRANDLITHAPPLDQCKIVINRGEAHHFLGRLRSAKADFARARDLALANNLPDFAFGATHNLSFMIYLMGDLPGALALMPDAEDAPTDFERGVVAMDRAKVLLSAGLTGEADLALQHACAAFERTELVQFLAEAKATRAEVALLAAEPDLAAHLGNEAVNLLGGRTNRRVLALAQLVLLKAESQRVPPAPSLREDARRLARDLSDLGIPDQARFARLIERALFDSVGSDGQRTTRLRAGDPIDLRLYGRLVRAKAAFARDDRTLGRREARLGMAELTRHQAQFGSLDLQAASAAHGVKLAALAIAEELAHGQPAAVLGWLESARAITSRVPEVYPPSDPETAGLLSQLRWVVNQIDQQQSEGRAPDHLSHQRLTLQRTIRARSWTAHGEDSTNDVSTVAAIRAGLGRSPLVAFFDLLGDLHALVLTADDCNTWALGPTAAVDSLARRLTADLDTLAMARVPAALRTSARRSATRALRGLDDILLKPLALPAGSLVILPPGRFAGLSWGSLPSLIGRALTVAPSATSWLRAHARVSGLPKSVVAVAGPGLERADDEVHDIARAWPSPAVLTGSAATGDKVLAAFDGADLVHVAAHGHHERDSPLFSSIKLFDGPLVGYDLDRLRRPPQQVVLSACDLGQATVRPGDEALGLTRALLHSGTSTVISGVAKVSDRGAADLMVDYHRRLATGSPPAYALAEALAATDESMPFVCFGAGW